MTRYEKQLQEITIEDIANKNVVKCLYWYSVSDGTEFSTYDEALDYEIEWLKGE